MGRLVVGIDPGMGGAIAILDVDDWTLKVFDMPTLMAGTGSKRIIDIPALVQILREQAVHTVIEKVHSMPGQGVASMFSFGEGDGILQGVLAAMDQPTTKVTPQTWKKALSVPTEKDGARARASELMPLCSGAWSLKKHDGRAEAAMIAFWWCRQNIKFPESIRLY